MMDVPLGGSKKWCEQKQEAYEHMQGRVGGQSPLSGLKATLDSSEKERENGLIEKAFPFFHGWAVKLCPH